MEWKSELARSITKPERLIERFDLDPKPLQAVADRYPFRITPYYWSLIEFPGDPLWRQSIPDPKELAESTLPEDSLSEEQFSPVPAVVHRYPDRALLLVSGECAGYCRFCTRKNRVGKLAFCFNWQRIAEGLSYLADQTEIQDVILTGGDPLLLEDEYLEAILERLRQMHHIGIVRIGSRVPVTLPARVTTNLCRMLSRHQPVFLNTHFNHPRELTQQAADACRKLADSGIVLGNQSVLLRDVNDTFETMLQLCRGLLKLRIRPYYLHQMDQAKGTAHFHASVERGRAIVKGLRGKISGLGIPQYVIDPPDGQGKRSLTDFQEA